MGLHDKGTRIEYPPAGDFAATLRGDCRVHPRRQPVRDLRFRSHPAEGASMPLNATGKVDRVTPKTMTERTALEKNRSGPPARSFW
jgi:hypothetical protein